MKQYTFLTEISSEYIFKKAKEHSANLVKYGKRGKGDARLETLAKMKKMLAKKEQKASKKFLDASEKAQMVRRNHANIEDAILTLKSRPIE